MDRHFHFHDGTLKVYYVHKEATPQEYQGRAYLRGEQQSNKDPCILGSTQWDESSEIVDHP